MFCRSSSEDFLRISRGGGDPVYVKKVALGVRIKKEPPVKAAVS
jgi:hypothetical protein